MSKFLSTPSARRATKTPKQEKSTKVISIHALREEGDGTRRPMVPKPSNFYPRPPRGGRPKATEAAEAKEYFYPRPPRGGRRASPVAFLSLLTFLSTPSARRATFDDVDCVNDEVISIHALREEGDRPQKPSLRMVTNFYPRPPRGGRPSTSIRSWPTTPISIHALREEGDRAGDPVFL